MLGVLVAALMFVWPWFQMMRFGGHIWVVSVFAATPDGNLQVVQVIRILTGQLQGNKVLGVLLHYTRMFVLLAGKVPFLPNVVLWNMYTCLLLSKMSTATLRGLTRRSD
jgi:hypothetical protein